MKITKINVPTDIETRIHACPLCGAAPVARAELHEVLYDGLLNGHHVSNVTITCQFCFISAPIDKWEKLCSKVPF